MFEISGLHPHAQKRCHLFSSCSEENSFIANAMREDVLQPKRIQHHHIGQTVAIQAMKFKSQRITPAARRDC